MKWIKMFKKSKKGSVTLMVLTTMMFVLLILTASYFAISNKSRDQDKKISQIERQYLNSDEDMKQEYINTLNSLTKLTMEQAQSDGMFEKTTNTEVTDGYGNKIVVPTGFKITDDATDVTQGVVIEDKDGNQFVWIPVGTVYTNVEKTASKTITLGRYKFAEDGTPSVYSSEAYKEDTVDSHDGSYGNAIAKDIEGFITSVNRNHGYYIGRYEAGVTGYDSVVTSNSHGETNWTGYTGENMKLVCKTGQQVWNYVTQNKASELSINMYTSSKFTSDLINSYAWDTAIVFIQKFSGDTDYSRQIRLQNTLAKTGEATDGTNYDVRCNIYDMSGNNREWTTETYNMQNVCVLRGGDYGSGGTYTSYRNCYYTNNAEDFISFRSILYIE